MSAHGSVDVVLAGVGGQGVLTAATILAKSAMEAGLCVKQGEVHGMSQRGGAVQAHLRISRTAIPSDLIPRRQADFILSTEPVEGLRYLDFLSSDGIVISSGDPFENIPDYPPVDGILDTIRSVSGSVVVPAQSLARQAGSVHAVNVVMVGAASPYVPMDPCLLEESIVVLFKRKGEKVVKINLEAFHLGRAAAVAHLSAAVGGSASASAGS